jgi:hypothetical protein
VLKSHTTRVSRRLSALTSNIKQFPPLPSNLLQAIRTLTYKVIRIPPGTLFSDLLTSQETIGFLGPSKRDHLNPINKPPCSDWCSALSLSLSLSTHTHNVLVTASATRQFAWFAWFVTRSHQDFHGYGRASLPSDVTKSVLTDSTIFSRSGGRMVDQNVISSHHQTRQASLSSKAKVELSAVVRNIQFEQKRIRPSNHKTPVNDPYLLLQHTLTEPGRDKH